ncbi:MAG: RNase H family protein, partial [Halocynthiibacter sp.]
MPEIFVYTDGACSGNPGPGGWGALLQAKDGAVVLKERSLSGGEADTTNNRMELLAAIHALEAL